MLHTLWGAEIQPWAKQAKIPALGKLTFSVVDQQWGRQIRQHECMISFHVPVIYTNPVVKTTVPLLFLGILRVRAHWSWPVSAPWHLGLSWEESDVGTGHLGQENPLLRWDGWKLRDCGLEYPHVASLVWSHRMVGLLTWRQAFQWMRQEGHGQRSQNVTSKVLHWLEDSETLWIIGWKPHVEDGSQWIGSRPISLHNRPSHHPWTVSRLS